MLWARIDDAGRTVEFTREDPTGRYHPDVVWLAVPPELEEWVDHDYVAVDGVVAPPSLDHIRDQAKARVAARRYRAETGGVTLPDGTVLRTDRESQSMVGNAVALAQQEPEALVEFKAASGWVTLGGAEMQAIGRAVGAHVRACFSRERAIGDLIDAAASPEEVVAIYAEQAEAGWPGAS